jgi:hypothetical protein
MLVFDSMNSSTSPAGTCWAALLYGHFFRAAYSFNLSRCGAKVRSALASEPKQAEGA